MLLQLIFYITLISLQLLDGSLESADHAEGEDTNVDSAHAQVTNLLYIQCLCVCYILNSDVVIFCVILISLQLLVEGSANSVDQTEGEDAFNDSTHTQVTNWLKMSQYPVLPTQPKNSLAHHRPCQSVSPKYLEK